MAAEGDAKDLKAHQGTYAAFTALMKWGAIVRRHHRLRRHPDHPQLGGSRGHEQGTGVKIAVLKESEAGERRVAATPETVKKFIALGASRRGRGRGGRRRLDRRRGLRGGRRDGRHARRRR